MKFIIFLLAAGIFILPAYGETAPEKDIHAVMAAEEGHGHSAAKAAPAKKKSDAAPAEKKESALEEEMDDLGDESVDEHDENGKIIPLPYEGTEENSAAPEKSKEEGAPPAEKEKDAGTAVPLSVDPRSSSYDAGAHGDLTAIDPITLKDGDWVFIEGDERRGWFFDRSMMAKNTDGSIAYWQLILYNDLGRAQFVRAMHDANMGYFSINHPVDRDPVCGYNGIIDNICPRCGRKENGRPFERIRRITGYLVGTIDRWNNAKRAEEHDRVKHGIG